MNKNERVKKLIYRSWHRGCKETDLLLGEFAKVHLPSYTDQELDIYEKLAAVDDVDLYNWISGVAQVPANYDTPIFRAIVAAHDSGSI
ncbi:MAG: succinate dehydrogenase assembly factor 2 [Rickettsiales bacterium]